MRSEVNCTRAKLRAEAARGHGPAVSAIDTGDASRQSGRPYRQATQSWIRAGFADTVGHGRALRVSVHEVDLYLKSCNDAC